MFNGGNVNYFMISDNETANLVNTRKAEQMVKKCTSFNFIRDPTCPSLVESRSI
jgi:hypothetical protein